MTTLPSIWSLKKPRPELLLHPNIPKPLHGLNPRTILGKEWWDEARKKAYAEHGHRCWACHIHAGSAKHQRGLHAHEVYSINFRKGQMVLKEVSALCFYCHNYIHDGRLQVLHTQGVVSTKLFNDIMRHGVSVLKRAGYKRYKPRSPKIVAPWDDWHIIIEGKKYYGKSKGQWLKEYG